MVIAQAIKSSTLDLSSAANECVYELHIEHTQ